MVKNFRCFAGLVLNDLARVNLIAGKNNTGKTALLEAIHLHCHPAGCDLAVNINKARGIANPEQDAEGVVRWLFWQRQSPELDAQSHDECGIHRTLTMWLLDPVSARARFPEAEKALATSFGMTIGEANQPRIILRYEQQEKVSATPQVSIAVAAGGNFYWLPANIPWKVTSVFLTSGVPSTDKDVDYFSALEVGKRQDEILPALRILEPRLEKLSLVPLAGQLVIHGDIGLPRLVPLPLMGEGIRRVLSMVLAIANAPGGVVLIDEVENGLHHSVMVPVWQAIAEAARRADVQVFATTHSYECIQAAQQAFATAQPYDLRLLRLDRLDSGIRVATYNQNTLNTSIEMSLEVR
ncbi:MAG: AAA family ATPase [Gemmataceae bacterium]